MTLGGDSSELSALYMLRQFAMLRARASSTRLPAGWISCRVRWRPRSATSSATTRRSSESRASAGSIAIEYETRGRVERLTASHVILTVPFSTLRQIEFRPRALGRQGEGDRRGAYYPGVRILLQSRNRFWNRVGLNGSARTGAQRSGTAPTIARRRRAASWAQPRVAPSGGGSWA